ncbi:MAG: helix-turn-helix domain-containing protein [Myxococcota bacterium]
MSRQLTHTLGPGVISAPRAPSAVAWKSVVPVLAAADELAACADTDEMLRRAVELARERIGLERVGLYIRDPSAPRLVMRGTWGTGVRGEVTDEHSLYYECDPAEYERLRQIQGSGALWQYYQHVALVSEDAARSSVVGHGWLAATPLVAARELVGVLYNDTAITHAPFDEGKQALTAVFCSLLAGLFLARRPRFTWSSPASASKRTPVVQRAVFALHQNPRASGESIARELSISPGYLGRSFKAEMGVSLVEYRNRLRIERFFSSIDRGKSNLLGAALEAGFGSYTHFHRVYRKFVGATPRDHLTTRPLPKPSRLAEGSHRSSRNEPE